MAKGTKVSPTKRHYNSPAELQLIKKDIIAGVSPKEIHEKYGTSIVNIHYHKAQLKKQGLLKDIKVKRGPKPTTATPSKTLKKSSPKKTTPVRAKTKKIVKSVVAAPTKVAEKVKLPKGPLQFVVNGVKISIDKKAKAVNVGKSSITVEF